MANYIISGGPGAGKTTLLNALGRKGFECSEEVSRQLIKEQVALSSQCLPWKDLACFARLALERMLEAHTRAAAYNGITFFDRAIPDIIAYLKIGGVPIDQCYYAALQGCSYQPYVFMAPPWEAIYVNDSERWQTFTEASVIYEVLIETYQSLGFTVVEIPKAPVDERLHFVVSAVEQMTPAFAKKDIPGFFPENKPT